jgi:hypothetical protein
MEKKPNTIIVEQKNLYGSDLFYPACEKAKIFASIANTKTLRVSDIILIKRLGYNFEILNRTI